ncbi:hypothetical protein D3C75_765650 [compost metagenome]
MALDGNDYGQQQEQGRRCADGLQREGEGHGLVILHQLHQQHPEQLGEKSAQQDSCREGDAAQDQGLVENHPGNLPLRQPQEQIQAELPLPLPHEEGVGIQDKHDNEHEYNHGGNHDPILEVAPVLDHVQNIRIKHQCGKRKMNNNPNYHRDQINGIQAEIPADIAQGQVKELHPACPPSMLWVSRIRS